MNRATARRAAGIWLVTVLAITAVAFAIVAAGSAGTVRRGLAFSFPIRDSWEDLAAVLWRNGAIAVAALMLARARVGRAVFIIGLAAGWAFNVILAGAALAAYGARLVEHAAVYGLTELAGFSVVVAVALRSRLERACPEGGELLVAAALLVMAALAETMWSLRL